MTEEEYMNYQIIMIAEQESHKVDNPGAYKQFSQSVKNVSDSEMTDEQIVENNGWNENMEDEDED